MSGHFPGICRQEPLRCNPILHAPWTRGRGRELLQSAVYTRLDKKLSSSIGFKGIFKKMLIIMLVGVAHIVDLNVVGSHEALRSAVICFYISNEGVSVLENASRLGLPIPEKLKAVLAQLHDKTALPEGDSTTDQGDGE